MGWVLGIGLAWLIIVGIMNDVHETNERSKKIHQEAAELKARHSS